MNKTTAQQTTKLLREIEDVIIDLDAAINAGYIEYADLEKLKHRFEQADESLRDGIDVKDSRLYVCDEAAALLVWISGEKQAASDKIADAVGKKGDTHLTSQAGRGMAAGIKNNSNEKASRNENPVSGWLGFFTVMIAIIMLGIFLISLAGTFALFFPPVDLGGFAVVAISWTLTAFSISYLTLAPRRSKRARPLAILLFGSLTAICIAILIAALMYGDYQDIPGFRVFVVLFLLFFIAWGVAATAYYQFSSRVRQVFDR